MVDHLKCASRWTIKQQKYEDRAINSITIARQEKFKTLAEEAKRKAIWHMELHLKAKNKTK